jgi:hypothetical protein
MARLQIANEFIPLTRPDAGPIWINPASVSSIRSRVAGDAPAANAVLSFSSTAPQSVRQPAAEVAAALELT